MYAYVTASQTAEERERFDALLEGRDYDRERRRAVAALIASETS